MMMWLSQLALGGLKSLAWEFFSNLGWQGMLAVSATALMALIIMGRAAKLLKSPLIVVGLLIAVAFFLNSWIWGSASASGSRVKVAASRKANPSKTLKAKAAKPSLDAWWTPNLMPIAPFFMPGMGGMPGIPNIPHLMMMNNLQHAFSKGATHDPVETKIVRQSGGSVGSSPSHVPQKPTPSDGSSKHPSITPSMAGLGSQGHKSSAAKPNTGSSKPNTGSSAGGMGSDAQAENHSKSQAAPPRLAARSDQATGNAKKPTPKPSAQPDAHPFGSFGMGDNANSGGTHMPYAITPRQARRNRSAENYQRDLQETNRSLSDPWDFGGMGSPGWGQHEMGHGGMPMVEQHPGGHPGGMTHQDRHMGGGFR